MYEKDTIRGKSLENGKFAIQERAAEADATSEEVSRVPQARRRDGI